MSTATRTALVTGGTSGIGLSLLPDLVEAGYFVHFIGRNEERGRQIEAELRGKGPGARFIQLDLSSLAEVRDFARKFAADVPNLHLLVNVAGVMLRERQVTKEGFEKTFAVDYLASFLLCRELEPSLIAAAPSRIVNVAGAPREVLGRTLDFDDLQLDGSYSLMSAALNAVHAKTVLTQILAERLAPHQVDVNSFHPGMVKGNLFRDMRFPMRQLFGLLELVMTDRSRAGVHACLAPEAEGETGRFFVKEQGRPLEFDAAYRARLWSETEALMKPFLA